jgi:hypothetical protein
VPLLRLVVERDAAHQWVEAARKANEVVQDVWDGILRYAEQIQTWDQQQRREMLRRMGVQVIVGRV